MVKCRRSMDSPKVSSLRWPRLERFPATLRVIGRDLVAGSVRSFQEVERCIKSLSQVRKKALVEREPGMLAFVVSLLVIQAKLGYVPFDIPEAEQEIMGGPLLEYSGPPLGAFKIVNAMLFFTLPVFLITLYMGGIDLSSWLGILWFVIKYVIIVTLVVLIKNTNPRIRIDQAVRFFWGIVTVMAAAGFILALLGW